MGIIYGDELNYNCFRLPDAWWCTIRTISAVFPLWPALLHYQRSVATVVWPGVLGETKALACPI